MQLSLFSVSYAGFWGQQALDLEGFIARAAQLGFRTVMLMGKRPHLAPLDAAPERIASLRGALDLHGVRCGAVAAYTDLAGGQAAEVPYLELQIAYVESLARIGTELGASAVRVFTAYETAGQNPQVLWSRVVSVLREICDRVAGLGVTIAIQNHHDLAVSTAALLELLHDIDRPNCKAAFDAWSPALRGEDLHQAARQMAPYTAMTTNADYLRLPRFHYDPAAVNYLRVEPDLVRAVKFGEGFIDYPAFFRGLADGGFDGIANYEMCSPIRGGGSDGNLDEYARQYLRWMCQSGLGGD